MTNQDNAAVTPSGLTRLETWLLAPFRKMDDVTQRRQAELTAALSIVTFLVNLIGLVIIFVTSRPSPTLVILLGALNLLFLGAYFLGRTPMYKVGAFLLTGALSAAGYTSAFSLSNPNAANVSGSITSTIPIALVLGGGLLGITGNLVLTLGNFILTLLLPNYLAAYPGSVAGQDAGTIFTIGMLALVLAVYRNRTEKINLSASQNAAEELQKANRELESSRSSLETRTQELQTANEANTRRAAQLEAISRISESISTVHDLQALLPQIAQAIGDQFGVYHVGIFLLDDPREFAVLRAANSESGQKLVTAGFRVRVASQGLIGYVSAYGVARIALEGGTDALALNNADLPETRSEIAIPMIVNQQVIGVLDIQSNEPSAFGQEDLKVLTSLGNQVGIVIQNTRQFEETNQALQEARSTHSQTLQSALSQVEIERRIGYRLSGTSLKTLDTPLDDPAIRVVVDKGEKLLTHGETPNTPTSLTVPIKLRDEVIGVLDVRIPQARSWSADEVDIVEALAERVAIAVENATLLEETQRRAIKERVIGEITSKISSSINMSNVLQTAVEELGRAIPGSDVIIQFQNVESGR